MSKYQTVYEDIKEKIITGVFPANQELLSENDLMHHYHFSKDTIRKALSLLERDGYIRKQQGRNSIVLEPPVTKPQSLSTLKTVGELNHPHTHDVKTKLSSLYIVQGEPLLMETFHVDDSVDFYRVGRTRIINGESVEYEISYFDRRIVPYLNRNIAEGSIYRYLEQELNLTISHSQREISFRYANEKERKRLDLGDYDMVVVVKSTSYLDNGQAFQYGSISYRPDKITFTSTAKR
ncbi:MULTISPECIES: GntR family transcriptional regulator [unclassified Streptococcus]|uniref:GntR family transcriptional regulator n=1 Tax=unclassified Streptococcus TaxID=2608887 RepID=UPI001071AD22|nr:MULTISPECIES: GntR family transcriptional regulator [unclassified Streptococcus]MBF0787975.1 GntR family transcriptional regulator [Streptococcus sp. 19428wC2_LYSM12]MCQ9211949.1 GntR family transcriptional regulator [Streptococcus sp. B01]MCQ9213278.1 GntR family transcriptional regulator [Streptococcus sp. O1]TFV04961.1 GntR family transcriptional regulator [Streptococcus sp. LYSM12]